MLDNTADELADVFGVNDVPPIAATAVQALKPVYTPLKAVTPSCTSALYPEFNEMVRAAWARTRLTRTARDKSPTH